MPRLLGIKFTSTSLHCALIEGNRDNVVLIGKESYGIPHNQSPGEYADWAETQIDLIIQQFSPDQIIYKLTTGLHRHEQIFRIYFGIAILNLIAFKFQIPIGHLTPTQLRATAFGLPRGAIVDQYISNSFPNQESPWNANTREAVAIALRGLV